MTTQTLVLGAGFGGLAAAAALARDLPPEHGVTLVDARDTFAMGLAKLQMIDGRRTRADVQRSVRSIERLGVRFLQAHVERVDLATRRVVTDVETLAFDHLVVALGARLAPDEVRGLEAAHNLYSVDGIEALNEDLARCEGGPIVFVVSALPVKCPPAPYEAAILAKAYLGSRGVDATVTLATPEPHPLPVAGIECGQTVSAWVGERGVDVRQGWTLSHVDTEKKEIVSVEGERIPYGVLAAVPPHRAPLALTESGLVDSSGWVPVDARTLATGHDAVWAIGDCTIVKLANGKPLVKAGVMAEAEALVVAANIVARVRGEPEDARFDGKGGCYLELGDGLAVEVAGDFFAKPAPIVVAKPPSREALADKHRFEEERLVAWLGEPPRRQA